MLKAVVVGVGLMGINHARIYSQLGGVDLVAVCDTKERTAKAVAKKFNAKYYTDYHELLDKEDIDIASIVVPTKMHRDVAVAFMDRGIHILLEKPIAINEKKAEDIINAANSKPVKLMIGHIERFNPAIIELKKRMEKNELGTIYKIDVQRIGPFPSRIADVGVIIDLSVHDIDIINYLINSNVKRIHAETQQKLHPKFEDSLTSLMVYENDVLATLNINYLSPKKIREISVFGEKGMFKADYLTQDLKFYENPSYNKQPESFDSVSEGKELVINIDKKEPLLAEIEAFIGCVESDKPSPISGEAALDVLKIAHRLEASSKIS